MARIGLMFLVAFLIALSGFFLILFFVQERLIFLPEPLSPDYRFDFRSKFEERFVDSDGLKIDSLLFTSPGAKSLLLFFHGNAGSLSSWGDIATEFVRQTQADVWIMDYPGYGKSEGKISSEAQLHRLAKAFYVQAAKEAATKNQKLVIYGRSIGSGIAARVASENPVGGLILETPYYSLASLAQNLLPWVPGFLIRYQLPLHSWLSSVRAPILILHGDRDTTIPIAQSKRLATENLAHAQGFEFRIFPGLGHNDLSTSSEYWESIKTFLAK
jgi:pimeloyl-ACP methyl ester carboxylesterase